MDVNKSKLLRDQIRAQINDLYLVTDEEIRLYIEEKVFEYAAGITLLVQEKIDLADNIFNYIRGYDVLQPLLEQEEITEIMINGYNKIFVEKNGEIIKTAVEFESEERLEDIIQMIVSKVNRVVNQSSPIVDARMKDGSRVNIVLPPLALNGPTMTIRKFPKDPLTIQNLIANNTLSEDAANYLGLLVRAKYNIFISGGTGSGKTTLLNVLSNFIPEQERIVTIEDSAELQIKNIKNLVRLEIRNANTEGKGEVTISDLIRASLRMRPDRIVVGEVRGHEALDMLQAMNTGHDGSISTGHGNSAEDMLSRLEVMVLRGANIPVGAIRKQISSAIDIIIHLAKVRDNTRRIIEISELTGVVNNEIQLNRLYCFEETALDNKNNNIGELQATGNKLQQIRKLKQLELGGYPSG